MSWSDDPPRVLKKVHAFSKVSFEAFESLPDAAVKEESPPPGEDTFDALADAPETPEPFQAMTDQPGLVKSNPGHSRADCSEALEIVRKTEEEMAALKEETCRQCTLLEQEAYDKGFAAGEKDGRQSGEKKIQALAKELSAVVHSLAGLRRELVERYEDEVLDLVLAVCRKIIYCEVSLDSRVIRETVRHILEQAPAGQPITLRLHPKDMEAVEGLISSDEVSSTDMNRVSLKADTSVSRGGCRMETPHGDVDAVIETRIRRVYDALKQAGAQERAGAGADPGEEPETHAG